MSRHWSMLLTSPIRDNYLSAKDTFWSAWPDQTIHDWLVEHGYMRSDAQYKRDQLIQLANEKYVFPLAVVFGMT